MGRSPGDENELKKGPWTPEEDQKLVKYIQKHGHGSWRALPKLAGLNRCGKSCRLRWTNYLRPDIKRGRFSEDEEQTILHLHSILGNKWSTIASYLPGRTDNEVKNFWNTHLKKKLIQMGLDPMTHRPRTDFISSLSHLIALPNLHELINNQSGFENHAIRLQAEAAQMAKFQYLQYLLQSQASNSVVNSHNINALNSEVEIFNLLNSIKDTQLDLSANSLPLILESVPFAQLPELQVPCGSYQTSFTSQPGENSFSPTSSWLPNCSSSTTTTLSSPSVAPIVTRNSSFNNQGDVSSCSSYGGDQTTAATTASAWPDYLLLEDLPLFNEIV